MNWEDKLIDYIDGALAPAEVIEVEKALAGSAALQEQLEELKTVMSSLEKLELYPPSPKLEKQFQQLLNESHHQPAEGKEISLWSKYRWAIQSAAAMGLLALGLFIGMNIKSTQQVAVMQDELQEMKKIMLAMLDRESVSERIKAVNYSYDLRHPDAEISDALIHKMNTDKSANVRLAAIEALHQFASDPQVKKALIESLAIQQDPAVQITLINILVQLREKGALPNMQKLIDDADTMESVKGEAQMGIFKLTST